MKKLKRNRYGSTVYVFHKFRGELTPDNPIINPEAHQGRESALKQALNTKNGDF